MNASSRLSVSGERPHLVQGMWFWAWAAVGVAGALGLVSLGPIALGPAFIAGVAMLRSRTGSRSARGLFVGAGLVSLFVAYVQRDGPGTTCWHTASATGCDQHLNPIPWLVVGIVLVVGGVVTQSRHSG
jgi:4-amino-4-deoxy-L-arabinose transferase-like glycosyltransferase